MSDTEKSSLSGLMRCEKKNKPNSKTMKLPPYFVAKYLASFPVLQRAAEEFWQGSTTPTILVGQDRTPVPFDATQLLLRSGFYQKLTEEKDSEPPKQLLEAFAVRLDDPEFLLGWSIANGVMPLPAEPEFQNIYCDYLMISGYKPAAPEAGEGKKRPVPTMAELQQQLTVAKQRLAAEEKRQQILAEEKAMAECARIMQDFQDKIKASIEMPYNGYMTPTLKAELKANGFKVENTGWMKNTIILKQPSSCVVL
jgi:hypothetical protein